MSDNIITNIVNDAIEVSITQTSPTIVAAIGESNINIILESNNVLINTEVSAGVEFTANLISNITSPIKTWFDYVGGYSELPTLIYEDNDYQIYEYVYNTHSILYRKVSKNTLDNEFYNNYENNILSN